MRQTKSLPAPRWSLVRRVLAGCRQSLLGDGPSRHYLCNPCVGAWTHTPPRLSSALAHSFLESTGLTPRKMRSAREIVPAMQRQQGAVFRGCSHSFIFRLLRSLGPQIASTAASSCWAAGPFTPRIARVVTHSGMWHRSCPTWAFDTAGLAPQDCRLAAAPCRIRLLDRWLRYGATTTSSDRTGPCGSGAKRGPQPCRPVW